MRIECMFRYRRVFCVRAGQRGGRLGCVQPMLPIALLCVGMGTLLQCPNPLDGMPCAQQTLLSSSAHCRGVCGWACHGVKGAGARVRMPHMFLQRMASA